MSIAEMLGVTGLASDIAIVLGFVFTFRGHAKRLGIKDGEHMQIHKQLRDDIDASKEKTEQLEREQNDTKVVMAGMDAKLDGITSWLGRIDAKLEARK